MTAWTRTIAGAVLLVTLAGPAFAACPKNGGTLCNVPGAVAEPAMVLEVPDYEWCLGSPDPGPQYSRYVVWTDRRDEPTSGADIYYTRFAVGGACVDSTGGTGGDAVVVAPGDQSAPSIAYVHRRSLCFAYAGLYDAVVAWQDHRGPDWDVYARRGHANGNASTWNAPVPICSATGDQTSPIAIAGTTGSALFAWLDARDGETHVYAQRTDSTSASLWAANGIAICAEPGGQDHLMAAADGAGGAYLAWLDHRAGAAFYAIRIDPTGAPVAGWQHGGTRVQADVQLAGAPRLVVDGNGIAIAWTETGADPQGDVLMAGLAPDGSERSGWGAFPVTLADGGGAQRLDDLVSDATGGLYAVWEHEADGSAGNADVYAARIDAVATMVAGWPVAICTNSARQEHARASAYNGLLVVFADDRDGDRNLYVSHRTPAGAVPNGWLPDGNRLSGSPGVQDGALADGNRFVWLDGRDAATSGVDLYASSMSESGVAEVPARPSGPRAELAAPQPNPARYGATFRIDLPEAANADIGVYDCAGRAVRPIASGTRAAGAYLLRWDGRDADGAVAAPGVYFVRARMGATVLQRPLVVLR